MRSIDGTGHHPDKHQPDFEDPFAAAIARPLRGDEGSRPPREGPYRYKQISVLILTLCILVWIVGGLKLAGVLP